MADERQIPNVPDEESKKDTVRINLPPSLVGKTGAAPPGGAPTVKLKPAMPPGAPEDESKKETAVMGTPVATPKPKKDTSRVQVPAAKPAVPEMPRPTVKLKREEPPPAAPSSAPAAAPAAPAPTRAPAVAAVGNGVSGIDVGLAVAAAVFSIAVVAHLYHVFTH
jgi:hypothetical protein